MVNYVDVQIKLCWRIILKTQSKISKIYSKNNNEQVENHRANQPTKLKTKHKSEIVC